MERHLKLYDINEILSFKTLYSISKKLKISAKHINHIFNQREIKLNSNPKKKENLQAISENNEKERREIFNSLLNLCADEEHDIEVELSTELKNLREIQKNTFELAENRILFNNYLKISNYIYKLEENLLFSMFASSKPPSLKPSFINKILKIYTSKKKRDEDIDFEGKISYDFKTISILTMKKEFERNLLSYLSISKKSLEDFDLKHALLKAAKFRYKDVRIEKYIQIRLNSYFGKKNKSKALSFEEPLKNFIVQQKDKFDFVQTFDFHFKYVLPLLSKTQWLKKRGEYDDKLFSNKLKMIKYYFHLMRNLHFFLNLKKERKVIQGIDFLKVIKSRSKFLTFFLIFL